MRATSFCGEHKLGGRRQQWCDCGMGWRTKVKVKVRGYSPQLSPVSSLCGPIGPCEATPGAGSAEALVPNPTGPPRGLSVSANLCGKLR